MKTYRTCAMFLFVGILLTSAPAPARGTETLTSGEFGFTQNGENEWQAIPIDPVLSFEDWAQFFVDSGLDVTMSNGELLSDALIARDTNYSSAYFYLQPGSSMRAYTNLRLTSLDVDAAALESALNSQIAALSGLSRKLIETPASGPENVPLEWDRADISFRIFDSAGDIFVSFGSTWDADDSFLELDSTYRFEITADTSTCTTGTTNAGNGFFVDTLYVNGSTGGPDRTVEANDGDLLTVTMLKPIAGGNGRFVLHANPGDADAGAPTALPFDIGTTCFPFLRGGGASPVIIANNVGKTGAVGASHYFGVPTVDPDVATTSLFFPAMPAGTVLTFQSILIDPASNSSKGASTSNAVVLRVL